MKVKKASGTIVSKIKSKETQNHFAGIDLSANNNAINTITSILQQNDSPYIQLLQQLPAAIYTCNAKGEITFYNEAAAQLWGRRPQIGKDLWCGSGKIYRPDKTPMPLDDCPMAVTLKEGRAVDGVEIIIEKPDGKHINVMPHPRPLFDMAGNIAGAVNMLVDITADKTNNAVIKESEQRFRSLADNLEHQVQQRTEELVRRNEELRRSEERYHRMIAEVQDYAIILLDKNGIIQNWNRGAEKIKGYKAEEIIGKSFTNFYTDEDRERKLPDQLLERARTEGKANHEGWRVRKDGSLFWGSIVITGLHDDYNNIIGFSKVTRDLSLQKDAEFQLQEKNRELEAMNQELASFAYVSSHDLQEPLRKIQTFASRILETENENLSERGKDYFERMQNAAMRMQNLIEDLLTYSRTNTAEKNFQPTDLNLLLEEIKNELWETIEEKNAVIQASQLPTLDVVPFQFRQLMINILGNALKFSKPDVSPIITITRDIVKGNTIKNTHAIPTKQYHHIAIRDNGIGFEPEHSNRIFEVFQRLHGRNEYSGTGIGLAICKKIMDNHGGMIMAESALDKGATFHLYFPYKEAEIKH